MLCLFVVASQLRQKEEKKELTQAEKNALEGQAILNDPSAINTHPDS